MKLDNNQQAFFVLVKAGLWEQEARLLPFEKIDYSEVLHIAEEQSVIGLVAAGLEHVVDLKVPTENVLQFVGSTLQLEQKNLAMNEFLAGLIERLRRYNVYAVLVKGQGIAQCYEKPLWRVCGDIDLLLSEENYKNAKKLLVPLALSVEQEYTSFKHLGMTMEGGFVVELHGTMHSRLSRRVDKVIDNAQDGLYYSGEIRTWENGNTMVFLPAPDNDVIFVFTHILRHFFFEGIGLRQICDWCRLLWKYRMEIDQQLLESRIKEMGLMSEWKAFAAYAVEYLGMPEEAMPFYSKKAYWSKKASKIGADVLKVGNFGHKQRRHYKNTPYLLRKFLSLWGRMSDMLRHFMTFPIDSVFFFRGVLRSGLHAVIRGE